MLQCMVKFCEVCVYCLGVKVCYVVIGFDFLWVGVF